MYFKPKIFISSTFDLLKIREELQTFFEEVGAEVMLYEKNLTPSINPATYRQDILEADFIIFIFDASYGTKTDTGKSGTHEEFEIAGEANLPKHVYIKLGRRKEKQLKKFIATNIQESKVSFYFYKDEVDLLEQIRKTTFTIARDITLKKINQLKLEENSIRNLAMDFDFKKGLKFIKGMEDLLSVHKQGLANLYLSTLLLNFFYTYQHDWDWKRLWFIDNKMNSIFFEIFKIFREFQDLLTWNFTTRGTRKVKLKSTGLIYEFDVLDGDSPENIKKAEKYMTDLLKEYENFKEYIFTTKKEFDINIMEI